MRAVVAMRNTMGVGNGMGMKPDSLEWWEQDEEAEVDRMHVAY